MNKTKKITIITASILVAILFIGRFFYADIRSYLGHSFIDAGLSGIDIYYKGKKIASTGTMVEISYNKDFSEISINGIVNFKNGKRVIEDKNLLQLENTYAVLKQPTSQKD